jgi:hypothetical protein
MGLFGLNGLGTCVIAQLLLAPLLLAVPVSTCDVAARAEKSKCSERRSPMNQLFVPLPRRRRLPSALRIGSERLRDPFPATADASLASIPP